MAQAPQVMSILSRIAVFVAETCTFGSVLAVSMLYDIVMRYLLAVIELNLVPDFVLRRGIRMLLAMRLKELKAPTAEEQTRRLLVSVCAAGCSDRFACAPGFLGEVCAVDPPQISWPLWVAASFTADRGLR